MYIYVLKKKNIFFCCIFQTAYEEGHTEAVIRLVEKYGYDVNYVMPSSGLSLFLVCLNLIINYSTCLKRWEYILHLSVTLLLCNQVYQNVILFECFPFFSLHFFETLNVYIEFIYNFEKYL